MRFDVLSRELNVFEPHFLEASAGTGKTFAIEHLVTRLVIEGLLIEQILVVTFTRAATRELKARIRQNLHRVREDLANGSSTLDYLLAICEKGERAIQAALERIDAALICYDSAQIYTLHGFCHRVLTEFSFEANVHFEVTKPDENTHIPLLEQMAREHLKDHVALPQYSPAQMSIVLKKYRSNPRSLVASLVAHACTPCEITALPSYSELLEAFCAELRALPDIDNGLLLEDFALLRTHYRDMTGDEVPLQMAHLAKICASKECTTEQFDQLLVTDYFLEYTCEENRKVKSKLSPSDLHYPGLIDRLRAALLPLINAAKNPSHITLRLAKDLQEKGQELLDRKEQFSPDALLLKVEQALKMPRFVERVRQKYRAAIVDEFQDTDPVQWNIFRELFLSKIDSVCLVGDPKQSIYAFRNADVYVYLEAAKAMGADAKKYLDTNFRSTPKLVDALNTLFARAQGKWMDLPSSSETLEVLPVKAGSRQHPDDQTPIEVFISSDKKGRSKKFPTEATFQNKIFPYLASEICRLHTEKGIPYHEIAVLIKDRKQGKALLDYFKQCGIPASARRAGTILESDAFPALREALAAACAPYDMSCLKTALGGLLIGWDEEMLAVPSDHPLLLDAKAKMQLVSRALFERGFGAFIQVFLATSWNPSGVALLEELDLPLYIELRKLCEMLIEEEIKNGLKDEAFLTFLEELALDPKRDEPRFKVPFQEEKGSVAVLTMHMSKGLEFDIVFALGLASRHPPPDLMVVKQDNKRVLTAPHPSELAALSALQEVDAEKMRQLYVALTRAKSRLYIPLLLEDGKKTVEIGGASPSELFFARIAEHTEDYADLYRVVEGLEIEGVQQILETLSPHVSCHLLQEAPVPQCPKDEISVAEPTPLPPLCLHDEPLFSFSSLAKKEHEAQPIKIPEDAPLSPHTMPLGADTGILLHTLFEKIFKRGLHNPLNKEAIAQLIETTIAYTPLEKWLPVLLPWAIGLFTKPISGFSLSQIPPGQVQQEVEFFYATKDGMMKGFADLFFEFEGKYYILDWKSNYLGVTDADYTQEKMAEAMQSHQYDLQASIYADALERYVKLFDTRPFSECFGGAIYYFVRGKGVYHFVPDLDNFRATF